MTIYDRIEELLFTHHQKKADLCRAINVSTGNMTDWSKGRSQPSIEKLIMIADYYGVPLDYLCCRDEKYQALSPDCIELTTVYQALDRAGRAIVLGTAYQQKQNQSKE